MRDQLDRYGEVDPLRSKWQEALKELPKRTILILNTDDPGISFLAHSSHVKIIFFGINDQEINLPKITNIADIKFCLNCHSNLNYKSLVTAHMCHYACSKCNFERPKPNISAQNLKFKSDFSSSITLMINDQQSTTINYSLPGLYNVYNILAASAICQELRIDLSIIKDSIEKFTAAFGRFQKMTIDEKKIVIFLIKNPAGANEVIRTILQIPKINILVILNDKIADGRDVSWIWDTNWEVLKSKVKKISVSGIRAWDMAVRLKYAGIKLSKNNIYKEISYSIAKSLDKLSNKDTLMVLPTYTALLEVQRTLSKMSGEFKKWHHQ